jgi:hypothetical protein
MKNIVRSIGSTLFFSNDVLSIFKKYNQILLVEPDDLGVQTFLDTIVNLDAVKYFDFSTEILPLLKGQNSI